MVKPVTVVHILLVAIIAPILMGCSCLEKTDLKEFRPSDYSDFVYTAFKNYWKVMDDEVVAKVNPKDWTSFKSVDTELKKYDVDFEKEFITRTLKKDKLWSKYISDRKKYESDNPGKTYKDQIIYYISEMYNLSLQPQTKTVFLYVYTGRQLAA